MTAVKDFVKSVLAGMAIALGGIAFVTIESRPIGALVFTIGLFTICTFGWNLYTGKVCYAFGKSPKYLGFLGLVWLGNFIGTVSVAGLYSLTRACNDAVSQKVAAICDAKLGDSWYSIFILAVFCNILIYIAVESFASNPHPIGKYLGLFFGVCGFILCGYEHCVANMFYLALSGKLWSLHGFAYLLLMTAGNSVGGLLVATVQKQIKKEPVA